ncbi:MAG: hypothetical protein E6Q66_03700 [Pedobacter sp.]|jgi:hypothetical protein|nr:MAG: hypothetical protein E6Q66_03700 [Pedobacter sp.]
MFFDAKMALTVSKTKNSITRQDKIDFFELPQKNMSVQSKLHYLNASECDILLGSIRNQKHKLIVLIMLDCGLRVSECRTLKYSNFDFKEKLLTVSCLKKRGMSIQRVIPISDRLYHLLAEHLASQKNINKDSFLFPGIGKNNDGAICRDTVNKLLTRLKPRTNIYHLHPHALRHTFATHLLINDVPIHNIKSLLGHNKLDTTLVYTHIPVDQLRSNISSLAKKKTFFRRWVDYFFPIKSKPINISFSQQNISVGRNDELQLLQGLSLKRVNTFIIGDIGVGKSHLLEQICVSIDHVLRFDDLDNIKRTLGNTLLYLYKNEKQTVYNLIYGDFDLNKAQTRITRESVANLCDEIKKVTVKKEYTIVIDSIDGITPKTVRVLELLKDHFTIIAAARSIKVNHTSLFWDFERIQIKSLSRHHALELIQRLTHDLEVEDYYVLLNHIYEQTNGNPRAIYELVNRYRKEPILTKEVVKSIRHAGALPEYDMTIFIAIILGAIACLRYFTAETGNVSLRTIGGCALILLLLSRYIFPKFKRKYI